MPSCTLTICNKKGLHARAAAKFVKCAEQFTSEILVKRAASPMQGDLLEENPQVLASSILGLMMLGASQGTEIEVEAHGEDAAQALDAIKSLIESKFEEGD